MRSGAFRFRMMRSCTKSFSRGTFSSDEEIHAFVFFQVLRYIRYEIPNVLNFLRNECMGLPHRHLPRWCGPYPRGASRAAFAPDAPRCNSELVLPVRSLCLGCGRGTQRPCMAAMVSVGTFLHVQRRSQRVHIGTTSDSRGASAPIRCENRIFVRGMAYPRFPA